MRAPSLLLPALACALLLGTFAAPAEAQWKWRDKSGRITISDLPPPRDVPPQDILQRPDPAAASRVAPPVAASAPATGAAAGTPPVDKELQARKQAAEQEQVAKAKAEADAQAQQRVANCRAARSHMAALESGQRLARYNDKGEREVLDDKQRADETRRAREVIASDCR